MKGGGINRKQGGQGRTCCTSIDAKVVRTSGTDIILYVGHVGSFFNLGTPIKIQDAESRASGSQHNSGTPIAVLHHGFDDGKS